MAYKKSKIYLAHKALGFPALDRAIQLQFLMTGYDEPIHNIVPELRKEGLPLGLIKEYITITPSEFKAHLRSINFIQKQLDSYSDKTTSGYLLRKIPAGFEFIERERGHVRESQVFSSEEAVLDAYVLVYMWYR